jgi:hypothetical protein
MYEEIVTLYEAGKAIERVGVKVFPLAENQLPLGILNLEPRVNAVEFMVNSPLQSSQTLRVDVGLTLVGQWVPSG